MKWNWFSPLPPAKSGIAEYTASVLPFLAAHAEITLWTDRPGWDPCLERLARVRVVDKDTVKSLCQADVSFFNIGNNLDFHGWIWELSRRHPGIVILHDLHVQHMFYGLHVQERRNPGRYLYVMNRYYGQPGVESATALLAGRISLLDVAHSFTLADHAVENALGVVVHNPGAWDHFANGSRLPLFHLPLPHNPSHSSSAGEAFRSSTPVDGVFRLALVGHIGGNRRLDSILTALASFPQLSRIRFDIFGEVSAKAQINAHIIRLELTGRVTMHGFVSDEVLNRELQDCHLAFNLRYPTMGESSLSQLRYWEYALPTLVTPSGWYGTLSEDVVGFVRVENEEADIHHHLEGLLADPEKYYAMGERGRQQLLEHHSCAAYAAALKDFTRHLEEMRLHHTATLLSKSVGRAVGRWGAGDIPGSLFPKAAERILGMTALPNMAQEASSDMRAADFAPRAGNGEL